MYPNIFHFNNTTILFWYLIPVVPPFKIQLHTGAEMTEVLKNVEEVIDGFSTKLKVEYDDQDLKGLMDTAQREKLSSSQVPEIVVEQTRKDDKGNEEKEQVFSKFIFSDLYYYLFCKDWRDVVRNWII